MTTFVLGKGIDEQRMRGGGRCAHVREMFQTVVRRVCGGIRLPVAVRDVELVAVVVVCGDIVYIAPAQPVLYRKGEWRWRTREARRKKKEEARGGTLADWRTAPILPIPVWLLLLLLLKRATADADYCGLPVKEIRSRRKCAVRVLGQSHPHAG